MNPIGNNPSDRASTAPAWVVWLLCAMVVVAGLGGSVLGSMAFPRETLVDRPVEVIIEKEVPVEKVVEKTVERPVEVVKLVEKPVPAQLTSAQTSAIEFARKAFDFNSVIQGPALIKLSDKVVVLVDIEGDGASRFSHSEVRTEVENAFRLQGFRVLPAGSKEYPYTVATVSGIYLENRAYAGQVLSISGAYEISLRQPVIYFNSTNAPDISQIKFYIGEVPLYRQSGTLNYGSNNFDKVPGVYAKMAATAASELRKAMDSR